MMVTQASLARRLRHIEARIGADAGDEMVYVTRGMKGLHTALRDLEERRNPPPVPALTGTKALLADIERVKAMIEAREQGQPSEPEPPIVPLPRAPLPPRPQPATLPQRPPPRAPAPVPKPAAKKPSATYDWADL